MSDTDLVLPEPGTQLTLAQIEGLEMSIAAALPEKDDVEELHTWLAQAGALAAFIKRKDLQGPIMGAMRRIEARIGQLLPDGKKGTAVPEEVKTLFPHATERHAFRLLGKAAPKLTEEEWRQPRQTLVGQLRPAATQPPPPKPKHLLHACAMLSEWSVEAMNLTDLIPLLNSDELAEIRHEIEQTHRSMSALLDQLP